MAFNETNIKTLLDEQIQSLIVESDYSTLKKHLLKAEPIIDVTLAISNTLEQRCNTEKQSVQNELTTQMCGKQQHDDMIESQKDRQKKQEYYNKKLQLRQELSTLNLELNLSEDQYQLESRRHQLTLSQINHSKYQYDNALWNMTNNNTPRHYHHHYKSEIFENTWHIETYQHGTILESQKAISRQEINNLQKLSSVIKTLNEKISKIKEKLEHKLPKLEKELSHRDIENQKRAQARTTFDPQLAQLSHQNRDELNRQINNKHSELEQRKWELNFQAINRSHEALFEKLSSVIKQQPSILLNKEELQELRAILAKLKIYFEKKTQFETSGEQLKQQQNSLAHLNSESSQLLAQLKQIGLSNEKLKNRNLELNQLNSELNIQHSTADESRQTALTTGLISLTTAGLGAALISALISSSSLLLLAPGGLGLVGIGALVFAIHYHLMQRNAAADIAQNAQELEKNQNTVAAAEKQASAIRNLNIPTVEQHIEGQQQSITSIESHIANLGAEMQELLHSAQTKQTTYASIYPFFQSSNDNYYQVPQPSAPREDLMDTPGV